MGRPGQGRPEAASSSSRVISGRRRLLIAAAVVAAVESVAWLFIAGLAWSLRGLMVGVDSPIGIERTRFALVLFGVAGINVLAVLAFAVSRMRWGWWALIAVQVADLVFATYELLTRDLGWLVLAVPAALTAGLLLLARRPRAG